jgi:hypothetical protein
MKFRKFRLHNAADATAGGGAATLMTDGAQTTPAAESTATTTAPAATAPAADAAKPDAAATQQTSTDNPADSTAEKKDEAADKPAEKAAPEKYEFKAPDGVTLDAEVLGEFEGIARELKLPQEEAQKLADVGVKLSQKWATQQAQALQDASAQWAAEVTADKEIGGDKLPENLAVAKKALETFGSPALGKLLNDSRLGNHPEVIRFMVKAGKVLAEDRIVTGGAGPTATQSTAKALYPNQS